MDSSSKFAKAFIEDILEIQIPDISVVLLYIQPDDNARLKISDPCMHHKYPVNSIVWFKKLFLINPNLMCSLFVGDHKSIVHSENKNEMTKLLATYWQRNIGHESNERTCIRKVFQLSCKYRETQKSELVFDLMAKLCETEDRMECMKEKVNEIQIPQIPVDIKNIVLKYVVHGNERIIKADATNQLKQLL